MNMGEASSLEAFRSYCYEEYPARNYALILWDHGGGPMEGVCFDDTQNRDSLSLSELASALASTTPEHGLAWIGIDACLMASFETASICSPYADYLIARQDTEPASGWNYSFLKELSGELPGDHIPHLIVDSYISQNNSLMLTLSCIDLSQIDIIRQAMDKMFNALEQQLTVNSFSQLSNERRDSKSFGRATTLSDYDLVDLYHLAQQYEQAVPDESAELQSAIKAAVYSSNQKDVNGVSLYSPYYNKNSFSRA